MNNFDISNNRKAMNADHAEKRGAYRQLFRIATPVIDAGDILEIEQYFSGYGLIDNAKVNFYTSEDIFDSEKSIIYHSLGTSEDGSLTFGVANSKFTKIGLSFDLSKGVMKPGWEKQTYFFDVGETIVPQISTEMNIGDFPPMKYNLYTQKKIKPGTYTLEFNFTYYNGENWECDKKSVQFKVRNFLEKHSTKIGILALVASLVVIIASGIIPLIKTIIEYF